MLRKIFYMLSCPVLAGLLSAPAGAQEPHDPSAHKDSVYQSGPVLTLPEAVERAIQASPRLKSVAAGLEAAKGAEDQAGYWPNPELEFEAENIAGSGPYHRTNAAEYTYSLSQTVEIGGKRPARRQAAEAVREAASARLHAERLNLERDVHIAYEEVLAEAEALKLARKQEALARDVLTAVSKRVEAAAEPEIQRNKAEVAYSTSVIAREQEERQLHIAKEKLARLWGASSLDVSLDHAHFFALEAPEPLENYQSKLADLPDIQQLAYLKAEKESLAELEEAQRLPDPNFRLGVRDYQESGEHAFVFGVSLPLPVLNQNQGNIAKARAELLQTENDARQAELTIGQQLIEHWQHWNSAHSEAERLRRKLLPSAEKAFRLARAGYEKGRFPYLEVLDAQRTLFDARSQYHNALKRYHTSRAHVERLTAVSGENQ